MSRWRWCCPTNTSIRPTTRPLTLCFITSSSRRRKTALSFQGNDGAGVTSGANTVYDLQGELHFTFTKPGAYEYLIRGDLVTDGQKAHADRYTFEHRQYTVYFYIANDTDNGPKLTMRILTAQDDSGIKENFVELDPVYKGPTSTPPETGDATPIGLYELLMLGSAVLILLFSGQALRKKGKSE